MNPSHQHQGSPLIMEEVTPPLHPRNITPEMNTNTPPLQYYANNSPEYPGTSYPAGYNLPHPTADRGCYDPHTYNASMMPHYINRPPSQLPSSNSPSPLHPAIHQLHPNLHPLQHSDSPGPVQQHPQSVLPAHNIQPPPNVQVLPQMPPSHQQVPSPPQSGTPTPNRFVEHLVELSKKREPDALILEERGSDEADKIEVTLENERLWRAFHCVHNEMIVTKAGR